MSLSDCRPQSPIPAAESHLTDPKVLEFPDGSLRPLRNAAFFGTKEQIDLVYGRGRREEIARLTNLYPLVVDLGNFDEHATRLGDVEVIFSTWGMPLLTSDHLDKMPSLSAVFFAAGTVQSFARPLLERGIMVVSAWQANATPVAEFTQAHIILATKGYFRNTREFRSPAQYKGAFRGRGNYDETVALLGAGAIGRKVIQLLRPFRLHVIVFDPFLSDSKAAKLGIEKVTLEAAFERGHVVSNHLANLPETERMLHGGLFATMRENATFINTGRGATVDEESLISVLEARPDLTAVLDVTWPEPPEAGSPLYDLPNVQLSTHIAGSMGDEIVGLSDHCIQEFKAWENSQPLRSTVSAQMLQTMS